MLQDFLNFVIIYGFFTMKDICNFLNVRETEREMEMEVINGVSQCPLWAGYFNVCDNQ